MTERFDHLTVGELQHILVGLYLAKEHALRSSPIIDSLTAEVEEALDVAIKQVEQWERT